MSKMTIVVNSCVLVLIFCCSCIAVTSSDDVGVSGKLPESFANYIITAVLPDGESETRMRFGDILVRESSVTKQNGAGIRKGLLFRQVASGPHLLQLIYKLGKGRGSGKEVMKLVECEIVNDWGSADQFRHRFQEDLHQSGVSLEVPPNHLAALKLGNTTIVEEDNSLEELEMAQGDAFDLEQRVEEFKNVSVRILRNDEVVGDVQKPFDMISQQKHCKRLHRRMKKSLKQYKGSLNEDVEENEENESQSQNPPRRSKREAFQFGIMPGTLWCGDGSLADRYEDMGAHVGTDRCCREHDGCLFIIHGMQSNYGVFNYRMHTVSHCNCDERFRSCLKQTNTGSSNFVGKLFFNVVQTKCFVLKLERRCTKRSWWGKCLKFEFKKQAHLRDPIPY